MHRIVCFLSLLFFSLQIRAQSPHGESFKVDCASCHSPVEWAIQTDTLTFNHDTTNFALEGNHQIADCKQCHTSLIFDDAPLDCASCHNDIHSASLGNDCARCHNSENWLIDQIPELHEENGFALFGAHANLSCVDCHTSETNLRFDRIGNDCINCHLSDYQATENPNHMQAGYSTNCIDCHDPRFADWGTESIIHDFFPLELGHDIQDCNQCHSTDNFQGLSPECVACHQVDYENAMSIDHIANNFSTDCAECHNLNPDWRPAKYLEHDALYFPIYSGEHEGEWNECLDCHQNPNNFAQFTCTGCHQNPETDNEHNGVSGYTYEDHACLACHPNGDGEGAFDHNATNFPLTGAHIGVECMECHTDGFAGTPTDCASCHQNDFNNTNEPDHVELNLSMDCVSCHTTDPDWTPATFDVHDDYYPLVGAHAVIAGECLKCHQDGYDNTPNTCIGCHQSDYDNTNNPNHSSAQFPTDCLACHNEIAWTPVTFDHDDMYFPIYSGNHQGEWNNCNECHTIENNFAAFSCIDCHEHSNKNEVDDDHDDVNNYSYESNACYECHPKGEE